jgi:hypothetical protein
LCGWRSGLRGGGYPQIAQIAQIFLSLRLFSFSATLFFLCATLFFLYRFFSFSTVPFFLCGSAAPGLAEQLGSGNPQ